MHHVAIMNKSWHLIEKILSGEKTIESRWYASRRAPWNTVRVGDTIYFKNSGEDITAAAKVKAVEQFEMSSLKEVGDIIKKYGQEICLVNTKPETWGKRVKYCVLIWLTDAREVKHFSINKKGFGSAAAWLSVSNINKIKMRYN